MDVYRSMFSGVPITVYFGFILHCSSES